MSYTCKTCGAIAETPGHLCNPYGDKSTCSFCGEKNTASHVCKGKLAAMKYVCENCGRMATEKEHVCEPSEIK